MLRNGPSHFQRLRMQYMKRENLVNAVFAGTHERKKTPKIGLLVWHLGC